MKTRNKTISLLLITIVILIGGCRTKQLTTNQSVTKDSIRTIEKIITKFDTIQNPADSAIIKAYLECDSLGNVLIRELSEEKGKMRVKTIFRDNIIEVRVNVDSAAIIRRAIENYKKELTSNNTNSVAAIEKKKPCNWLSWLIWGTGIGVFLSGLALILIKKL